MRYDSIYIDSLNFGSPIISNYIEYKWLVKDMGLPICTITDNEIFPVIQYQDSLRDINLAIIENKSKLHNSLKVFPNPAHNKFSIIVKADVTNNFQINIDISSLNLKAGLYFIQLISGEFQIKNKLIIN